MTIGREIRDDRPGGPGPRGEPPPRDEPPAPGYADEVGEKERRKLRARTEKRRVLWFGLGLFGTVGWSVAIPALVFLAAGVWLDEHHPVSFSWTLTLLIVGVGLGCLNAWLWIQRKMKET